MEAINRHRRLELQLAVTGMHLLRGFGHTVNEIKRDGWRIDARVRMQRGNDDPLDQALGLSRGIAGLARFFDAARTDVVLVLGDRIEAMAAALAAVSTGRILGHIHGGDVAPGDFDDSMRHAISKLAHVHFAATRASARRLVRMGESPQRVHHV
ncbi:MAG: UDP-N-acetylglucosamine 2-epimerase, partial [Planctomycetes bacterium]|nr:UDP-N-acetylglucosamine 2-epimerase [Planctomycetota bacterium]